jgi:hypothetical protein
MKLFVVSPTNLYLGFSYLYLLFILFTYLFIYFYCFIIHMCIQGLGHFSPLLPPPPLPPTPSPPTYLFLIHNIFKFEEYSTIIGHMYSTCNDQISIIRICFFLKYLLFPYMENSNSSFLVILRYIIRCCRL